MHSPELQRLLDREAIRECLERHARGMDRHDDALLASAYHDDAVDTHGDFSGTPEAFVRWANAGHERHARAHQHLIANTTIELDGDVAHCESYVWFALQRRDDDAVDLGGGRYLDRLERRHGAWRIARRELVMEWHCTAPSAPFADVGVYPRGTWDRSDPSYALPGLG